jgi:hypothetical protein
MVFFGSPMLSPSEWCNQAWLFKGTTRGLKDGEPDIWQLAEKADQFFYLGKVHTRAEFARVMEDAMGPANLMQIG